MNSCICVLPTIPSQKTLARQRLLLAIVAWVLPLLVLLSSAAVKADQSGDFIYTSDGTSVTITGYTGSGGAVTILDKIIGLPVTSIGRLAFYERSSLTSVSIPSSVTSIGDWAFAGCGSLIGMTIPSAVNIIGEGVFLGCEGLTNIDIPSGVTSIGGHAFSGCSSLASVTIPSSVTLLGAGAFTGCSSLASVTIPSSVKGIGEGVFSSCSGLTSLTIPSSVTSIGDYAFFNCNGLTNVAFAPPSSLANIGDGAFSWCHGLTAVTIPSSVTSIGDGPFLWCSGLTSIMVDPGNPNYMSLGGVLFDKSVDTLIQYPAGLSGGYPIPSSVTHIGGWAFFRCYGLTSVTIPPSVTNIGFMAFNACYQLTAVTIPSSVTSIGDKAFNACFQLTAVTIPSSVTSIGEEAFAGCARLTSIVVDPGNLNYSSLGGVLFDKSLVTLIQYPGGLMGAYTIPSSVTRIGNSAFFDCGGLTSVMIPSSVTSIGNSAFFGCGGLTSVMIPSSVTSIGDYAFAYCDWLTSLTFFSNAPTMGTDVFNATAPGFFTVYFFNGASGFTSPTWMGYPSVNMGDSSSTVTWLLANGFPYNADLQSDPNKDGVPLAVEHGLGLSPGVFNANPATCKVESNRLALDFSISEVRPAGVRIYVEEATALNDWHVIASKTSGGVWTMADGATASEGAVVSGRIPVTVRSGHNRNESSTRFLRLGVELPTPTAP